MKSSNRNIAIRLLFLFTISFTGLEENWAQNCVPLTINCPADITVTADPGDCAVSINYVVSTSGDCALVALLQTDGSGLTSGDDFPIGTTSQSWASEDSDGNVDSCSFSIIIVEFPNPITDDACNANINLSPDNDCEVLVTADMVLEGGPYGCYDNYIVTLTTLDGSPVPNPITAAYIEQTIIASVQDPSGNMCWGYIHYEDYYITPLQCGSVDINCRNEVDPSTDPLDSIPFPIPQGYTISPTSGVGPFTVTDYDNCGDIALAYTDNIVELDCTNGGPYTRTIYRSWTATDGQGNTTSCTDTINLRVPSFSSTNIFPNRDGTDAPAILCSGDWDLNMDGIPQPDEIGDELNMNCDVWGEYDDYIHYLNCGVIIDRNWQVVNMCTGEYVSFIQSIRLVDDEAPEISCESELSGSTLITNCYANYHVPHPQISDDCSHVTYLVTSSAGDVINLGTYDDPAFVINNLPIGWHTLTFTAIDGCGNEASCTSSLHIADEIPPQARCENNLTIYLGSGQDVIHIDDIDNYSSDACGIASMKLRRVIQGTCDGTSYNDTEWHDYEEFCCEEAGQLILIELGVWDIYGNFSSCISRVFVESNLAPSLTCPPDITVSCSFEIDLDDLSIFGSVVSDPDDVEDVVIDDEDWVVYCKGQTYNGPRVWGQDGLAMSECDFTISEDFEVNTICGRSIYENGNYLPAITREFIISNDGGEINSCIQHIYILDCNPQSTDIIWPDHVVIDACLGGSTHPDQTGKPFISASSCDEVESDYVDEEVDVSGDTCRHIIRHWTVISSCSSSSDSVIGEFDQNIYIIKSDEISLINCPDTVMQSGCQLNPDDGCEVHVLITPPQVVNCDSTSELVWDIDFDYDDQVGFNSDLNGTGDLPEYLTFGVHRIRWNASDMCGGDVSCETVVILIDCQPPTAVCEEIGVQFIQDTNGITIYAEDIAGMSEDNCGDVSVSFILADSIMISCDDLESPMDTFSYVVIVTDAGGNADTCTGQLIVADTSGTCDEPRCELIYAINSAGQYYSINTATGDFTLVSNTGVTTGTNAVAVNDDLGIGYYASGMTFFWVDLITGETAEVGDVSVPGTLTAAAASYKYGHLYYGPEQTNQIVDIYRIKMSSDGKSFDSAQENLTNGSVPIGNFGDFVVLDGGLDNERMVMSIFNNISANIIWEYSTNPNTFTQLSIIPSANSSQITIDNVGNIWYFSNALGTLGIVDIYTGAVSNENPVSVVISDMGRAWCPPAGLSANYNYAKNSAIQLFQNHPNPFTDETEIEFYLKRSGLVALHIYSMEGVLIKSEDLIGNAGMNSWRMTDKLRTGAYICSLRSGTGLATMKMVKID